MKQFVTIFFSCWVALATAQKGAGLHINNGGQDNTLGIRQLNVQTEILAGLARTTFDFTFYNNYDRVLEGEFLFPLPQGAVVTGFSLELDEGMRVAVIVDKSLGRKAFESTIRRRVDPALIEKVKGNNYRARVYPIPANGTKRLTLTYEQEVDKSNSSSEFHLPVIFEDKIKELNINIEVIDAETKPKVKSNIQGLGFKSWQNLFRAKSSVENYRSKEEIVVSLPVGRQQEIIVSKQGYFVTSNLLEGLNLDAPQPKKYSAVTILWDASMSRLKEDKNKEFLVLQEFFKSNKNVEVEFISFSNTPDVPSVFSIKDGDWTSLKKKINQIAYDGATNFQALQNIAVNNSILMFTDGLENFGALRSLKFKQPTFILSSSPKSDFEYLKYLSMSSGGSYINLTKSTPTSAIQVIQGTKLQFLGIKSFTGVSEVYPQMPQVLNAGFSIAGLINKDNPEVVISLGYAGQETLTKKVRLTKSKVIDSDLIVNHWAKSKVAHLMMRSSENKDEIIQVAQKYGLVTDYTSLIVLDRLEDYLQYKIVPPKELQESYFARLALDSSTTKKKYDDHMTTVVEMFERRKKWYAKDFVIQEPKSVKVEHQKTAVRSLSVISGDQMMSIEQSSVEEEEEAEAMESYDADDDSELRSFVSRHSRASAVTEKRDKKRDAVRIGSISVDEWNPETPYAKILLAQNRDQLYQTYLTIRAGYLDMPAFYLDVADLLFKQELHQEALKVLSNVAELKLEDYRLMRVLAHKLEQIGENQLALSIFKEVLKIRNEEPQSYRDLGLVYAKLDSLEQAKLNLYKVVETPWDNRFPEIELIALGELNHLLATHPSLSKKGINRKLVDQMNFDLRVVLTWDIDNCDMDLWVIEPTGEKCYYSHPKTQAGGQMSRDFTRGYGPEEYMIKKAVPGKYQIKVNYYGISAQSITGPVTIQVKLISNYGSEFEKVQTLTRRLADKKQILDIGEISF